MKNVAEVKKSLETAQQALNTQIDTVFQGRHTNPGAAQVINRLDLASKAVQRAIGHVDAAVEAAAKKAEKAATAPAAKA